MPRGTYLFHQNQHKIQAPYCLENVHQRRMATMSRCEAIEKARKGANHGGFAVFFIQIAYLCVAVSDNKCINSDMAQLTNSRGSYGPATAR